MKKNTSVLSVSKSPICNYCVCYQMILQLKYRTSIPPSLICSTLQLTEPSALEYFAPCKGTRILESGKFLLAESATMGFRIKNIAGSNPNLVAMESKIHVLSDKYLKTVLDSLRAR